MEEKRGKNGRKGGKKERRVKAKREKIEGRG